MKRLKQYKYTFDSSISVPPSYAKATSPVVPFIGFELLEKEILRELEHKSILKQNNE